MRCLTTMWFPVLLLAFSAHALPGYSRRYGDELALSGPLLSLPTDAFGVAQLAFGGPLPPLPQLQQDETSALPASGANVMYMTHLTSSSPDEEEHMLHNMDVDHDSVISSSELQLAIKAGNVPDARIAGALAPGRTTARFFLSLHSPGVGSMAEVQQVIVTPLEPAVATATFGVLPARAVKAGSQAEASTNIGHQHVGGFMQKLFRQNLAAELQVKCTCHSAGTARFQVTVAVQGSALLQERFVFDKACRGDELRGFDVGTTPFGKDAVVDGTAIWTPSHVPVIPYHQAAVKLYLSPSRSAWRSGSVGEVRFQSPVIQVWDMADFGATAAETPMTQQGMKLSRSAAPSSGARREAPLEANLVSVLGLGDGNLNSEKPTEVTVAFKCLKPSTALVEVRLVPKLAWDPFRPMSIFMKKECHGGFKPGFNVGMINGAVDLVRDGRTQAQIADVGSHEDSSEFLVEYPAVSESDVDKHVRPTLSCKDVHPGAHATPVVSSHLSVQNVGSVYNVSYKCHRPGVSVCTLSLGLIFWKSETLHWRKRCGGTAADVVIESSFAQSAVVFDSGQAASMWAPTNPAVSLASADNVAVFTVRSSHGVSKRAGSEALSFISPKVLVSDPSMLDVIVSRDDQPGSESLVLIARHVCKKTGMSQVTITLPRHKSSLRGAPANEVDDDPSDQVAFAYRKVCTVSVSAKGLSFLRLQTITQWDVPTGGWRFLLVAFIVFLVGVTLHECGHRILSRILMREIREKFGHDLFGTEIEVGSLSFRPWTGVFVMKDFVVRNPEGCGYKGDYLLRADEVSVLTSPKKVLYTLGRKVEVRLLRLTTIDVQIEWNGFVLGQSNMAKIRENMNEKYEDFLKDEELLKDKKRPNCLALAAERRFYDLLDHAVLKKAAFVDIHATAKHPLMGGELRINDIHFDNFSKEFDCVGIRSIANCLGDAFSTALHQDALGETGAKVVSAADKTYSMGAKTGAKVAGAKSSQMSQIEEDDEE